MKLVIDFDKKAVQSLCKETNTLVKDHMPAVLLAVKKSLKITGFTPTPTPFRVQSRILGTYHFDLI